MKGIIIKITNSHNTTDTWTCFGKFNPENLSLKCFNRSVAVPCPKNMEFQKRTCTLL